MTVCVCMSMVCVCVCVCMCMCVYVCERERERDCIDGINNVLVYMQNNCNHIGHHVQTFQPNSLTPAISVGTIDLCHSIKDLD